MNIPNVIARSVSDEAIRRAGEKVVTLSPVSPSLRERGAKVREALPLLDSHKFEYFCIIG